MNENSFLCRVFLQNELIFEKCSQNKVENGNKQKDGEFQLIVTANHLDLS